jgi:hypothetical protein
MMVMMMRGGGGARALETSRAEALHDLDRNSIGNLGLSGVVPNRGELEVGAPEPFLSLCVHSVTKKNAMIKR